MKQWLVGALVVAIAATTVPSISEAKRLGSGKSSGMQRDMPARTAPDAPPAKPATPTNAAPATAGAAAAAPAAAAAAGKKSWLGPIAGIAAGLGIAALLSHFGLGEGFATFLTMLLMAVAAFFVIRFLLRRFGPKPAQGGMQYAGATAGSGTGAPPSVAWPPSGGSASPAPVEAPRSEVPPAQPVAQTATAAPVSRAFVPASFDSESFARIAKTIFIRLQAANDARNVDDIRRFTTPELFASLQLDLLDRGAADQATEVIQLDTEVLDVADEAAQQVVSVRFRGLVREEAGADPASFDEVWHLVKPHADGSNWLIAGIEQLDA
jgi:predicted lipid-binding transport protein (Tim44 family)